jgi:hypothetical protein
VDLLQSEVHDIIDRWFVCVDASMHREHVSLVCINVVVGGSLGFTAMSRASLGRISARERVTNSRKNAVERGEKLHHRWP